MSQVCGGLRAFGHGSVVKDILGRCREYKVPELPPGYTHSLEKVGDGDPGTQLWADELFDPERPDTYSERVIQQK